MKDFKPDTRLVHAGRDPWAHNGIVNPPVYHASTILFRTVAEMEAEQASLFSTRRYGRIGTPTSHAFETAVAVLEGGSGAVSMPSGLAAITTTLFAFLKAGDHALVVDTAYGPTRNFCDRVLGRFGVSVDYYDPLIGAGIAGLMRPETRAVFLESPGSQTFEVQDVPAIAAAARAHGAVTIIDNTWATPVLFQPLSHGVDVVIHAATKYIVGHADANLGVVVAADPAHLAAVKTAAVQFGQCAGPDDLYLALRGLRTLRARLRQHQESALTVARWLAGRPEVARVLYPALESDPGHALWRRDFTGASGLFGAVLQPFGKPAVSAMLDHMDVFAMGASWGGYESLILPAHPERYRTATTWQAPGPLIRLHVGLEDPADLIADLERGFARLRA